MSYRFNNGRGAVTCDKCNIIFAENLGPKEYAEVYGKNKGDFCLKHRKVKKETKNEDGSK